MRKAPALRARALASGVAAELVAAAGAAGDPEQVQRTPQHGLYSNEMALITSDCGAMRSMSIKWL